MTCTRYLNDRKEVRRSAPTTHVARRPRGTYLGSLGLRTPMFRLFFLHFVVEAIAPEVFLGLGGSDAREQEQGDKVWNGHEGVHAVCDVPDDVEADDGAEEKGHDIEDAVETISTTTLNVVDGTLAIVAPAKDGAKGKGQDAESEQRSTYVWDF